MSKVERSECLDCCKFAEVGAKRCSFHIYKPAESLEDIMVWADGTWAYREEMYMMQHMSDDYSTLYVGAEEYEKFCIANDLV